MYQNRSADLADGLFLELCFHVGGDTNFFDYAKDEIGKIGRSFIFGTQFSTSAKEIPIEEL